MNDFEDQLERGLRAAADRVTTRSTEVDLIMSAGAQRTKRRQARLALGGVVVAGVAVIGSVAVLTRDRSTDVSVASESESSAVDSTATDRAPATSAAAPRPGDGAAVLVPSNLTWRSVDVDSSEALGVYSMWGTGLQGGGLYEVATEPGRSNRYQPTVWRSDDGLAWQPGGALPMSPRSIAAADGSIYAVGTAPGEGRVAKSAGGDAAIAISADGGGNWDISSLPVDLPAIEDLPGVSSVMVNTLVTDGPAGVLVVVQPMAMPDLGDVPGYSLEYGWVVYEDGVGIYGPDATAATVPCDEMSPTTLAEFPETSALPTDDAATTTILAPADTAAMSCGGSIIETRRLTWAELGADAETVAYLQGRTLYAFLIAADGTATSVGSLSVDDVAGQFSANSLVATDSSYVLMANSYSENTTEMHAFTSADGATWARSDIGLEDYMFGPVAWAGGLAGTVQRYDDYGNPTDSRVVLSADGSSWSVVDLDPVLDQIPLDGVRWAGNIVGGDSGISILVAFQEPVPGSEVVGGVTETTAAAAPDTAPTDTAPADPVTETTSVGYSEYRSSYALLHSADGVNWSYDLLDELRDVTTGVGLRQSGNQLIVSVQQPSAGGALPNQLALVGTPTS